MFRKAKVGEFAINPCETIVAITLVFSFREQVATGAILAGVGLTEGVVFTGNFAVVARETVTTHTYCIRAVVASVSIGEGTRYTFALILAVKRIAGIVKKLAPGAPPSWRAGAVEIVAIVCGIAAAHNTGISLADIEWL